MHVVITYHCHLLVLDIRDELADVPRNGQENDNDTETKKCAPVQQVVQIPCRNTELYERHGYTQVNRLCYAAEERKAYEA